MVLELYVQSTLSLETIVGHKSGLASFAAEQRVKAQTLGANTSQILVRVLLPQVMPKLIDAVRRGVMLAGGLPVEFPTISVHESFSHPTSMFLRNLMSMDTEEMIRAQPRQNAIVKHNPCFRQHKPIA